jgi:hypothetical protein
LRGREEKKKVQNAGTLQRHLGLICAPPVVPPSRSGSTEQRAVDERAGRPGCGRGEKKLTDLKVLMLPFVVQADSDASEKRAPLSDSKRWQQKFAGLAYVKL